MTMSQTDLAWDVLDGQIVDGLRIEIGVYGNGRHAITAIHPIEGPYCTVTVNLSDDELLKPHEFFVPCKYEDQCSSLLEALKNWATPTQRTVSSGFVTDYARVWALIEGVQGEN